MDLCGNSDFDLKSLGDVPPHYPDSSAPKDPVKGVENPALHAWINETVAQLINRVNAGNLCPQVCWPSDKLATHDAYAYRSGQRVHWGVNGPILLCSGDWPLGKPAFGPNDNFKAGDGPRPGDGALCLNT